MTRFNNTISLCPCWHAYNCHSFRTPVFCQWCLCFCLSVCNIFVRSRGGQIQIKSNLIDTKMTSSQIKSNHALFCKVSNQIKSWFYAKQMRQIKSNHALILISNHNFGRNQNQAIIRSKMRFHRQIWHRSKALSELFPSVPLVSPESTVWIKNGSIMIWQIQIKSNQIMGKKSSNQIKSRDLKKASNQIKSRNPKYVSNQIKRSKNPFKSNQIMIWFLPTPGPRIFVGI